MASVYQSGCDFLGTPAGYSDEGSVIVGTGFGGMNQNGATDTRSNTHMAFAARYLIRPGAGTGLITASELSNLNNAGVSAVFICENVNIQSPTAFASAGAAYSQGQSDGIAAQNALQSLIGTSSWPVYFAGDYDYTGALSDFFDSYIAGVSATVGYANTGIYGDGTLFLNCDTTAQYFWQSRSSGWSGNGSYVTLPSGHAQNMWQWPPGYTPSGNVTLTGSWGSASVDGNIAFDVFSNQWFGQYPKPGSSSGVLTNATVTNPTMTFTQPAVQTINVPTTKYDQVLYSSINAYSVTSSSWPQTITGPSTGVGYAYAVGNYSATVNGTPIGTNDFGFMFSGIYGQYYGNLPVVSVQPIVDSSGNITYSVTYNTNTGGSSSATINLTINIALLAYPNGTGAAINQVQQSVGYQNAVLGVSSGLYSTYRRIAGDQPVGTGASTVAHGQSQIPNLLYWVQDNSGTIEMQPSTWTSSGHATAFGLSMDATNIYTWVDSANNSEAWLRWYKDN